MTTATTPSIPPPPGVNADLALVSITPSTAHAKVGDLVTFTIVAENYGPGPGEIDVNTAKAVVGLMSGGSTSTNCGLVNGPPPQPGTFGNDGSGCEEIGSFPSGATVIDTLIALIAPTSTGVASDTACTWSAAGISDPNPSNDCATATVTVDSATCSAGMPGATQTLDGHTYNLEGEDTFTKDAPLGSFPSNDYNQVVYTGDHGMGWTEYPDGWKSTNSGSFEGYEPSTVQSVHDGVLDFDLHNVLDSANLDHPVGASISPQPAGNRYQTYGAWSFCERVPPDPVTGPRSDQLFGFHQAPLLWPMDTPASPAPDSVWKASESDFPESDLAESALDFTAFAHYGGQGAQDIFRIPSDMVSGAVGDFDPTQWNVYTQTWGPGFRSYFVNGQLVGTTTNQVYSDPERWQLQFEPAIPPNGTPWGSNPGPVANEGHVWIKWVWIGKLG
jgi:hypothetical protein